MTIKLHGYLPDKELGILTNLLNEHDYKQEIVGYFTDDEFISETESPEEIVELIASTFMPTPDSVREARAEDTRQMLFTEYDHMVDVLNNRHRRGSITDAEYADKIAAWDAYARGLELVNDTEGWYLNPQWPVKPEV
jgi:hypothetical protein